MINKINVFVYHVNRKLNLEPTNRREDPGGMAIANSRTISLSGKQAGVGNPAFGIDSVSP